jgi:NAD(P)-dependent dehydrogenase (short-subunit alcohol dehydrogenase family)
MLANSRTATPNQGSWVVRFAHFHRRRIDKELATAAAQTHRRRATKLPELAEAAAFVASDRESVMTGTVVNLTDGSAFGLPPTRRS